MSDNNLKTLVAAMKRLRRLELMNRFDPTLPDSKPTKAQQLILDDIGRISHRYVVAGNQSGKSSLGARETSWVFSESHPFWKRPASWEDEPLILLVLGRTGKQVTESLWVKIQSFLDPGEFKQPLILNGSIQKVEHINGNKIIFFSHHSINEAREKAQSYVSHYVWLDEMPKSVEFIEELHTRLRAREGHFLATFTPKLVNDGIRKLVDSSREPVAKKYYLSMLENPIYASEERQEKLLESMKTYSSSYRRTILYGDWSLGEEAVYAFDSKLHVEKPLDYSPTWRHVESVDPALKSKMGYTLWAQSPNNLIWYCVASEYIENIFVPTDIVGEMQKRTAHVHIVRRVCDTHESWYLGTASSMGIKPSYMTIYNKRERKGALLKNLQDALGKTIRIAPWCTDLIEEFTSCRWNETLSKIVFAQSYHLLDSAQYFVDLMPRSEALEKPRNWHAQLYEANEKRKQTATRVHKKKLNKAWRVKKLLRWR
ncbi:hypothetical protein PN36_34990 [Candidatus Thiomargarita nelsonii]|uniref:Uncharacterized protein n=1 Tax=Candidatus Thiomargarita nelsonii TaxID=1003181 RepID=A0A4E0QJI2_9GAMM|nr:hypothetical protein PN36_34990 [Candidatus Thiomargarita nelsonii]